MSEFWTGCPKKKRNRGAEKETRVKSRKSKKRRKR